MNHAPLPFPIYVNVNNLMLGMKEPGTTRALWHGVHSRQGQILMCHLMLETGAHWSGMPLHGISDTQNFIDAHSCSQWGAMGERLTVTLMPYLEGLRVKFVGGVGIDHYGTHTGLLVDWVDGWAKVPAEHKPLNLIQSDAGWYGLVENNKCSFQDAHFVVDEKRNETKKYRRNTIAYWR